MGLNYGVNNILGKINKEESFRILKEAYTRGIRTLDTSEKYGDAHKVIGEFHLLYPNLKFSVITKIPPAEKINNFSLKIKTYLKELNIDEIDCLMFHSFNTYISCIPSAKSELIRVKL